MMSFYFRVLIMHTLSNETLDLIELSPTEQLQCEALINSLSSPSNTLGVLESLLSHHQESIIKTALLELLSSADDTLLAQGGMLKSLVEQTSESYEGQHLCACLVLRSIDASGSRALDTSIVEKARQQGFVLHPVYWNVQELLDLSLKHIRHLHLQMLHPKAVTVTAPLKPLPPGLQLNVVLASLPGSHRGSWLDLDAQTQGLALASLMDLVKTPDLNATTAALGAGPFHAILSQSDVIGCPIALRVMVYSLLDQYQIGADELAVSCSLHEIRTEVPFWRIAVRKKDSGLLLGGLDWPLNSMSADDAFYDGLIEELQSLGIDECFHVDGEYDSCECSTCLEPIYPVPSYTPWREAALKERRNPNGHHQH